VQLRWLGGELTGKSAMPLREGVFSSGPVPCRSGVAGLLVVPTGGSQTTEE